MEFQKERVFTALNADELKLGSQVILANSISELKAKLENGGYVRILEEIFGEYYRDRFGINKNAYSLAYLISEPEEKKLRWTDLKVGDIVMEKQSNRQGMVTGIDPNCPDHIYISGCGKWFSGDELEEWEKVEK